MLDGDVVRKGLTYRGGGFRLRTVGKVDVGEFTVVEV